MTTMQSANSGIGEGKAGRGGAGGTRGLTARFEKRETATGARVRVLVGGVGGSREIDATGNITGAIAHALWQARGGDSTANWVDAERVLEQLAGAAPAPAAATVAGSHARGDGEGVSGSPDVGSTRRRMARR